jgi:DNA-directed RNA polymerase sigma subunit (sigma70/sigma32)
MVLGVCQRCDDEERRMRQERPVRTLDSPYARWAQETLRSPHLHRAALSERQRAVLERRAAGCTLQEIADALGVTRERIRQIEGQCRRRLARAAGTVAHPPVVRQAGSALPSAAPRLRRSNSPPA